MTKNGSELNSIFRAAAKKTLLPLGCVQRGRSRLWLDDHGWWVGVIEFQPSSWSKGSYLNVGACWLWDRKDHFSFDDGYRVSGFIPMDAGTDIAGVANQLAEKAAEGVNKLRMKFPGLNEAAAYLVKNGGQGIGRQFDAGIAAGLSGDQSSAHRLFKTVAGEDYDTDWARSLKSRATALAAMVNSTTKFRTAVAAEISVSRELLKLPWVDVEKLLDSGR